MTRHHVSLLSLIEGQIDKMLFFVAVVLCNSIIDSSGCASLQSGELEIMMHRRLLVDDGRGVGEVC